MFTKKYLWLAIFTLLTTVSLAQRVKNKQFTLISYDLNISKDFEEELNGLESFIDHIKTYNDPGNEKLKAILIHVIYYKLKEDFEDELGMEILPTNTFMRNVKYDDYGYPNASIREALRKGGSKFYFKIDAKLESLTKKKRDEDPDAFKDMDYPVTYPQLSIAITLYNNEGIIPVARWEGMTTPKYPLAINEYLLKGFDNTEMKILPPEDHQKDNLYLMLDRAIHNTIQDSYNK